MDALVQALVIVLVVMDVCREDVCEGHAVLLVYLVLATKARAHFLQVHLLPAIETVVRLNGQVRTPRAVFLVILQL